MAELRQIYRRSVIGRPPLGDTSGVAQLSGDQVFTAYTGRSIFSEEDVPSHGVRSRGEVSVFWGWYSLIRFGEPLVKAEGEQFIGTKQLPNSHDAACLAGYTIFPNLVLSEQMPLDHQWRIVYGQCVAASETCHLCFFLSTVAAFFGTRLGNIQQAVIYGGTFMGRWDVSRLWLGSAAADGTEIPVLLDEILRWRAYSHVGHLSDSPLERREWQEPGGPWLSEEEIVTTGGKAVGLTLFYGPTDDTFWHGVELPIYNPADRTPLSGNCVQFIKQSFQDCTRNHVGCQHSPFPRDQSVVPARLICIGSDHDQGIKLVDVGVEELKYIALSYCWGKGKTLTLTSGNIGDFMMDIPWDQLPLTYQQAITVARMLHIPHLWIDSICIIQEGGRDWEVESSKMADIFANAEIVISADAGCSTDTGFLFDRQPECFAPCSGNPTVVSIPRGDQGPAQNIMVWDEWLAGSEEQPVEQPIKHFWYDRHIIEGDPGFVGQPVMARAWCFQERFSATRMIRFMSHEVVWECQTCLSCECGAVRNGSAQEDSSESESRPINRSSILSFDEKQLSHRLIAEKDKSLRDASKCWSIILSYYSSCRLTEQSDMLPAISGVARQLANGALGGYLAGLWRNDLPLSLLWRASPDCTRPTTNIAPSWSWASLIGRKFFSCWEPDSEEKGKVCVAKVIRAETTTPGHNPFGHASSGSVCLHAPVLKANLVHVPPSGRGGSQPARDEFEIKSKNLAYRGRPVQWHPDVKATVSSHVGEVVCVVIRAEMDGFDYVSQFQNCRSLVLVPSTTQPEAYERIGIAGIPAAVVCDPVNDMIEREVVIV
ncbi:hypothetical protein PV04_09155 [Phialophora macrospora]|uniref:Heterokaryon incompatibility domain-containing protein n=1 Tax=Phialophora macrospora TaxID=1851006 RepID=A0A0D2DPN4_9EURO|nr:hypothetical protein PV04_09155 [Phialophora macrospora]